MNSLKLIIGNKNYSSWSLRPWFFLRNLGIDFDEELVYLFKEDTEEKLSPYFSDAKVPLLIDSSDTDSTLEVWDSLAIIEYLVEKYPQTQGWPESNNARAVARSASAEMHSSFGALKDALPMNCRKFFPEYPIKNDVQQSIDRIVTLWEYCSNNYGTKGSWLFGEFSGADAMFAPVVLRLIGYDVKLTGFAADYTQLVMNNEHIQNWIEAGKNETEIIDMDEI